MTDPDEAQRFLALLGKDPATTYFRTIRHGVGANKSRKGRDLLGFDAAALKADNDAGDSIYLVVGNATGASGKAGGVGDSDIASCPALFVEWDDMPKAEQLVAWQELQLPEPTAMLDSGGKSVHCYWRLTDPITPEQWRKATAQLIAHCNSDPTCSNPSRVMRLPGFRYWNKETGKATGTSAALLSTSDKSYTLQQLLACLPDPQQEQNDAAAPAAPQARTYPPRPLEQVREALQFIPEILPDTKQRDTFLKLAWGLLGAVREAGESDPMALALLEEHSPQVVDAAEYLKTEPTEITANTFWGMARKAGWRPASSSTANVDQVVDGFTVHGDAPQGPVGINANLEMRSHQKRVRLSPHDVKRLLPERLGRICRDVRSGDVMTDQGKLSGNEISRLYVPLSSAVETWPKEATADAVAVIASANTYDPVQQYLEGIATPPLPMEQWQRLDQHLLGIDHPIAATFLPRYFISAVARTMEPGCDVRQLPVLIGPQWRGKTELGRILFGKAHYIEGVKNLDRDDLQRCHTSWCVELAELDGVIRRNDREKTKAFITEQVDTFQIRYDRFPGQHPRRFVFWGSSNSPPLSDPTGSTRFVCIEIPDRMLPLDWAIEHRNALWARALEQYQRGVQWSRISEEERRAIEEMNSDFLHRDPWADEIEQLLDDAQKYDRDRLPVTIPSLLEKMEVSTDRQTPALAHRVREIAAQHGWKHARRRIRGKQRAGLWPPDPESVHPEQGVCTPTPARANASGSAGAGGGVHPLHPFLPTKGKREEEEGRAQPAPAERGKSSPNGVHGVHTPQSACSAGDQTPPGGCTEGCTEGCTTPPAELQAKLQALRLNNPTWHPHQLAVALDPLGNHGIDEQTVRIWLLGDQPSAA